MTTIYYALGGVEPSVLLRRDGGTHEVFVRGQWQRTEAIMKWMTGNNNDVEEITEAEARTLTPAAFTV